MADGKHLFLSGRVLLSFSIQALCLHALYGKIHLIRSCWIDRNSGGSDMGIPKKKEPVIEIPLTVFETAETKEDLDDWLLSQNPEFIEKMRKARKDDLSGKDTDWTALKKELCIE